MPNNINLTDDDYEVVEEAIDDFSYFYDDEKEVITNRKVRRLFKLFSVLIIIFVSLLTCFIVGVVQMSIYDTDGGIVNKEVIYTKDYKNLVESDYNFAVSFYSKTENVNGSINHTGLIADLIKQIPYSGMSSTDVLYYYENVMVGQNLSIEKIDEELKYLSEIEPETELTKIVNENLYEAYSSMYGIIEYIYNIGNTENSVLELSSLNSLLNDYLGLITNLVTCYNAL